MHAGGKKADDWQLLVNHNLLVIYQTMKRNLRTKYR